MKRNKQLKCYNYGWLKTIFFIPFKGPSKASAHTQTYLAGQPARAELANEFEFLKKYLSSIYFSVKCLALYSLNYLLEVA